jgi:hypothetical protein
MMKLPSASGGGTAPSGSSFAVTNPGVFGSRVGGVGRGAGAVCAGGDAATRAIGADGEERAIETAKIACVVCILTRDAVAESRVA